ncbi:hypothetical protein ACFX13_041772 [Malus domestica]
MGKPNTRWNLLTRRLLEVCSSYFLTSGIFYYRPENQEPKPPDVFLLKFWCSYERDALLHGLKGIASPDRGAHDKKNHHRHHPNDEINHHNNKFAASSDTMHDSKKDGSSSMSEEAAAGLKMVWPPKFVIAFTNKEKEEDFMAIKGSKNMLW